jgi:hypothetical protein
VEERLHRLPNGFPATKKEIEDWEVSKEIMEAKTEEHLRELIKIAPKKDLGGGVRIKTIKHDGDLPPQPKTKAQLKKAARKEAEAKAAAERGLYFHSVSSVIWETCVPLCMSVFSLFLGHSDAHGCPRMPTYACYMYI